MSESVKGISESLVLPETEHTYAIAQLSENSHWPLPAVAEMYWKELAHLKEGATVRNYLGLLTTRKVRETLRHMPSR